MSSDSFGGIEQKLWDALIDEDIETAKEIINQDPTIINTVDKVRKKDKHDFEGHRSIFPTLIDFQKFKSLEFILSLNRIFDPNVRTGQANEFGTKNVDFDNYLSRSSRTRNNHKSIAGNKGDGYSPLEYLIKGYEYANSESDKMKFLGLIETILEYPNLNFNFNYLAHELTEDPVIMEMLWDRNLVPGHKSDAEF